VLRGTRITLPLRPTTSYPKCPAGQALSSRVPFCHSSSSTGGAPVVAVFTLTHISCCGRHTLSTSMLCTHAMGLACLRVAPCTSCPVLLECLRCNVSACNGTWLRTCSCSADVTCCAVRVQWSGRVLLQISRNSRQHPHSRHDFCFGRSLALPRYWPTDMCWLNRYSWRWLRSIIATNLTTLIKTTRL
jgi:hypothetical protein